MKSSLQFDNNEKKIIYLLSTIESLTDINQAELGYSGYSISTLFLKGSSNIWYSYSGIFALFLDTEILIKTILPYCLKWL